MGFTFAWSYVSATLTRCLFITHGIMAVWRVVVIKKSQYWILLWSAMLPVMEAPLILIKRKGHEFGRFSPSFLLYLCTVLPPIWILEGARLTDYQLKNDAFIGKDNATIGGNNTDAQNLSKSERQWMLFVEQSFPLILVIGRWLMPKGQLSHEELSHLLIEYLGIASDIMDLFSLFDNEKVLARPTMMYGILTVWSISLLQFTLVLTKRHVKREPQTDEQTAKGCSDFTIEVASVFSNMLLQEIPFLIIRLYALTVLKILDYTTIFFSGKNALVILVQSYRLIVLFGGRIRQRNEQ